MPHRVERITDAVLLRGRQELRPGTPQDGAPSPGNTPRASYDQGCDRCASPSAQHPTSDLPPSAPVKAHTRAASAPQPPASSGILPYTQPHNAFLQHAQTEAATLPVANLATLPIPGLPCVPAAIVPGVGVVPIQLAPMQQAAMQAGTMQQQPDHHAWQQPGCLPAFFPGMMQPMIPGPPPVQTRGMEASSSHEPMTGVVMSGVAAGGMAQANTVGAMLGLEKVKALVQSGGTFQRNNSGSIEYYGGETRLFTMPSMLLARGTGAYAALIGQLVAAGMQLDEGCGGGGATLLRYELPGSRPALFIDLFCDDDVTNMWEAFQEQLAAAAQASGTPLASVASGHKLRLCIEQCNLSQPARSAPVPPAPAETQPASSSTEESMGCIAASAFQDVSPATPAGRNSRPGAGSTAPTPAGVATPNTPRASDSEPMQGMWSGDSAALREHVSPNPQVALSDLEARLEVLKPDDLKITRFLGAGGYGEVYLCRWRGAEVAVKCLNPALLGSMGSGSGRSMSNDAVGELLKEAMMLGRLRHPNVVWVYGVVLPAHLDLVRDAADRLGGDGQMIDAVSISVDAASHMPFVPGQVRAPALVCEYLPGGSVRGALSRRESFIAPPATRVKLALDTARGMEYLHSKRVVHFDLKAANLLLGWREGNLILKVADFGLSKQRQQTYVTGVASLRGTLPWTAPEVIRSPQTVTEKVDVYSFGITMWELWTGREPYDGMNYHALLHSLTSCPGMRPAVTGGGSAEADSEALPPELAAGWQALMQVCWDEDPQARPSFSNIVLQLKAMLAALPR